MEKVVKVDFLLFIAELWSHPKISVQLRLPLVLFSQLSPWWSMQCLVGRTHLKKSEKKNRREATKPPLEATDSFYDANTGLVLY